DLFVCNYVKWSPNFDLVQGFNLLGVGRAFGPPTTFPAAQCQLYRNQGKGVFKNVSRQAGIEVFDTLRQPVGKSLGVIVCDIDEDGWPDIVVANDTVRNFFFRNEGDGKFSEIGQECGVAYADGVARGAMGIDFAELLPGKFTLLITNFANEPDTLLGLDTRKPPYFSDFAVRAGVAGPSRIGLRFGCFFFDYDLDGRLDYLTANGHLEPEINKVQPSQHYRQPAHLFWNTGTATTFELVPADKVGPDLLKPMVGRGSAFADIDGNGTLDVVLTENGGPARLLKNEGSGNNWIRLELQGNGTTTNKNAIGARVSLTVGKVTHKREVVATRGYLSCSELPLTFGLGKAEVVDRVEIIWPGKDVAPQIVTDLAVNKTHRIIQK
ncbi:MAG: CRTAC1 family protein, partial [Gemmataceae bacterium]|nr:CRTAC1 family protein [Gemmataceae bacterium]